jgi:hypothetical protein
MSFQNAGLHTRCQIRRLRFSPLEYPHNWMESNYSIQFLAPWFLPPWRSMRVHLICQLHVFL